VASTVVVVRPGGVEDADRLRAIRLEALADSPDAFGATYAESSTWSDARWEAAARDWNVYLAEIDGRVVGMASGGDAGDRPGGSWLFGMYVSPVARGTGAAGALVEAVSDWARSRGSGELFLRVTETMDRARAFYQKMGFTETGEVVTMDRDRSIRLRTLVRALG
jgi:GNAT superfamily N-acetyltransferase